MTGPEPPKGWKGMLAAPYALGPGKGRVHVTVRGRTYRAKLRSVLASVPGADPKAPPVLVMGHYDAWVYGAVDPGSGAAAVLEVADVLAQLAARGWKPTRGVLFALWDGEEWGMLGSTAWVESHLGGAGLPVAAAINVDSAARANDLYVGLTPGLRGVLDEALARVADPLSSGKTLRDSAGLPALPGFSSDAAPFLGFTPVPTAEIGFGRWYGAYHTLYDTPFYVARISDPGYVRCAALARAVALFAGMLATPRVSPFRFAEVAAFTERELREIQARFPATTGWLPAALRPLDTPLAGFETAAVAWDAFARVLGGPRAGPCPRRRPRRARDGVTRCARRVRPRVPPLGAVGVDRVRGRRDAGPRRGGSARGPRGRRAGGRAPLHGARAGEGLSRRGRVGGAAERRRTAPTRPGPSERS